MVSSSLKNLKELTENPFLILRCLGDMGTWGHVTAPWWVCRKDPAEKSRARKEAHPPLPPTCIDLRIREAGAELLLRPKCS